MSAGEVLLVVLAICAGLVLLLLEVVIAAGISALRHDVEQLELGLRSDLGAALRELRAGRPEEFPTVEGDTPGRPDP